MTTDQLKRRVTKELKSLSTSASQLFERLAQLEDENNELKSALEEYIAASHTSKGKGKGRGNNNGGKNSKKNEVQLEKKIKRLEKKLKQYKSIALAHEARDLLSTDLTSTTHTDDTYSTMRRLLSTFSHLVSLNTIAENEECPICIERLIAPSSSKVAPSIANDDDATVEEVDAKEGGVEGNTASLPCDHVVCMDCLEQLDRRLVPLEHLATEVDDDGDGNDQSETVLAFECPQCRKLYTDAQVVRLEYTENARWDKLVDVATEWKKINLEEEVSDEEPISEPFIDNDEQEEQEEGTDDGADEKVDELLDDLPSPDSAEVNILKSPSKTRRQPPTSAAEHSEDDVPSPRKRRRFNGTHLAVPESSDDDADPDMEEDGEPVGTTSRLRTANGTPLPPKPELTSDERRGRLAGMANKRRVSHDKHF